MVENVNERSGWKKASSCPVCDSKEATLEFAKYGIELVACSNCNLRYHSRIPANPNDIYSDPVYMQGSQGFWADDYKYRKERFGRERIGILAQTIGTIEGLSILDVGCGSGYFLDCARDEGAFCYGLEISRDIRDWVSRQLGIEVYDKPLKELTLDRKFDVITVFDMIEHVERPVELLVHAYRLLKEGGHVFIFTPNFVASFTFPVG